MTQRPDSLDGLTNVVMARKNLSSALFCFFDLRRTLVGVEAARFAAELEDVTKDYFNDFHADNQSTAREARTVAFLRTARNLCHAAPPGDFKAAWARPINDMMLNSHGLVVLMHNDKFALEQDAARLEAVLGNLGPRLSVWGALREENYTHREFQQYLAMYAPHRKNGRDAPLMCLLPVNKTAEWWNTDILRRQHFFYPRYDTAGEMDQRRHFHLGAQHVKLFFRRLYHSTVGYQRENAFDFLAGFEMAENRLDAFKTLLTALRNTAENPEWAYVREGTLYFGRRTETAAALLEK